MARPRVELHNILKNLFVGIAEPNVYFQPPPTISMKYPCIVYQRDASDTQFADNSPYSYTKRYQVTVIDPNPDSSLPDRVAQLPMCLFSRFFTADNLNHDVFNLFF